MSKTVRTVLGFDSWVGGAAHFSRLVPELREIGYRLVLIHIGSWGGDDGRPMVEYFNELEIRDISYYGRNSFDEILEIEKPAAVLFTSTDVFAHRSFNRYSILADIPTIHIYHGVVKAQALGDDWGYYKVNLFSQIRFVLKRIPKALFRVWPCYAKALYQSGANTTDWIRFLSDIIMMAQGKYIKYAVPDSRALAVCVYTSADVSHAVEKYGYSPEDIHVVGNPDLSVFGLSSEQLGSALNKMSLLNDEIIYIDTGLIYSGKVFDDGDDFFIHLLTTRDALLEQNLKLSVKLHPDHFRTNFPSRLESAGIDVIDKNNFLSRLQACVAVIVEPSTASLIPALVGVPLLLACYGKLKGQGYGPVLLEYPRAQLLEDMSDVKDLLEEDCAKLNKAEIYKWIDKNVGPLPATLMPKRVAEVVRRTVFHH